MNRLWQPLAERIAHWRLQRMAANAAAIGTHMTAAERLQLWRLSRQQPGSQFLEIGSYLGASACWIAAGLMDSGRQSSAHVHCVDTWNNDAMSEGQRDTFDSFQSNTRDYADLIQAHRGRSVDIAAGFASELDFIFFDGDHSEEAIRTDVAAWLPKLRPGGLAVFHDIGWASGVQAVVAEDIRPRAQRSGSLPNLYWAWL